VATEDMIAFEIYRNGKRLRRAGGKDVTLLTVILSGMQLTAPPRGAAARRGRPARPAFHLDVGGLIPRARGATDHPGWVFEWLELGDEIRIKIVRARAADPPARQTRHTAAQRREDQHEVYERMKREFERKR
jgi:hypothetical protein